jgi:alanine dehydrogenase
MLTLLVLSSLLTTPTPVEHGQRDHGKLIDAKACNASEAQRTATIATSGIDGKGVVYFGVDYTYNAATAVRMTCTTELPSSTNDYVLQTCSSVADGVWQ